MNINTAFASKNLRAADVEDGDMTLTMSEVKVETVGQGKDAEQKPILYFEETDKSLVLNKTNAATISKLYGTDTDGWTGKKITLFSTEVQYGAEMVAGIRVRMKAPPANAPTSKASAPAPVNSEMKQAIAARTEAWKAFLDATPSYEEDKRKEVWRHLLKSDHPGVAEKNVTPEQWFAFAEHIKESFAEDTGDFIPF